MRNSNFLIYKQKYYHETELCIFLLATTALFFNCQNENLDLEIINGEQQLTARSADTDLSDQPYSIQGVDNVAIPWVKVWGDEFDGEELDLSKWNVTVSSKSRQARNSPSQQIRDWRWTENNVVLNGKGQLVLSSEKVGEHKMECGSVDSRGKYEQKYGYLEARIKIAENNKGNHTAFWLQGAGQGIIDGTGKDGTEIDVFESAWNGNFTKAVVHIDGYGAAHQANTKRYETLGLHEGYHIFGLDWSPNSMDVYYDGEQKATYTGNWVPDVQEWLWLSVGASFGDGNFQAQDIGKLTEATVDYVRAYKRAYFRLVNKQTGKTFRILGQDDDVVISQSPNSAIKDWTQWTVKRTDNGFFYFVNKSSGKYMRAQTNNNGANIVQKNIDFGGAWTQWQTVDAGDGYVYVVNRETFKPIRPESAADNAPIVLTGSNDKSDWVKWKLELVE